MATWRVLPPEIRLMILQVVASLPSPRSLHLRSGYATVCREWQPVFEEVNFNSIKVQTNDLSKFDNILQGDDTRRRWLRRLHLRIKLDRYAKQLCRVPETEHEQFLNNVVFTHSICDLLEILAKWDADQARGLDLEIEAFSPSDRKELYGEAGLARDGGSRFFDSDLALDFTKKYEMLGPHGFPEAEVVSGFCILRRNRRNIDPRALLHILLSLPRLTQVQFETWHQPDQLSQEDLDREHAMNVLLWPQSLKKVSIFEHSDAFDRHFYDEPTYKKCPQLGRNLARRSLQLEEIYVSNFTDARFFLEPYFNKQPNAKFPVWTHLKQIALSSSIIGPGHDAQEINDLLQAAGNAARQMPLLEVMELYNANKDSAGSFTYVRTADSSIAVWKSTWQFDVENRVRQTWEGTVEKLTGKRLALLQEIILSSYDGPINYVQNMMTGASLVHPASCIRIMKDHKALSIAP